MTSEEDSFRAVTPADAAIPPGRYSWRTVYLVVLAFLVLWMVLLTALPWMFS